MFMFLFCWHWIWTVNKIFHFVVVVKSFYDRLSRKRTYNFCANSLFFKFHFDLLGLTHGESYGNAKIDKIQSNADISIVNWIKRYYKIVKEQSSPLYLKSFYNFRFYYSYLSTGCSFKIYIFYTRAYGILLFFQYSRLFNT